MTNNQVDIEQQDIKILQPHVILESNENPLQLDFQFWKEFFYLFFKNPPESRYKIISVNTNIDLWKMLINKDKPTLSFNKSKVLFQINDIIAMNYIQLPNDDFLFYLVQQDGKEYIIQYFINSDSVSQDTRYNNQDDNDFDNHVDRVRKRKSKLCRLKRL